MYTAPISGIDPIRRPPGISCAAWVVSEPIRRMGAASELVLVWWQEELDGTPAQLVERVPGGVHYEQHARDFDYGEGERTYAARRVEGRRYARRECPGA